jgi:hypothetical protein
MTKAWNASAITVNSSGGHNYTTTTGNYTFDSTDTS